jgi:ABC-type lipoprotein export system ATPase subunit
MVTHDQGLAQRTSRTMRIVDGEIDEQKFFDDGEEEGNRNTL